MFLYVAIQFSQHNLLIRLFFPYCVFLEPHQKLVDYIYMGSFLGCLLCLLVYVFVFNISTILFWLSQVLKCGNFFLNMEFLIFIGSLALFIFLLRYVLLYSFSQRKEGLLMLLLLMPILCHTRLPCVHLQLSPYSILIGIILLIIYALGYPLQHNVLFPRIVMVYIKAPICIHNLYY